MSSEIVTVPDWIFDAYRTAATGLAWVRLLAVHKRGQGEGQDFVMSSMSQAVVWSATDEQLEHTLEIDVPAGAGWEIDEWFETQFDHDGWVRVELTCELDGTNRAVAITEKGGPGSVDYLAFHHDPFWNYLDEHRPELEKIAAKHVRI